MASVRKKRLARGTKKLARAIANASAKPKKKKRVIKTARALFGMRKRTTNGQSSLQALPMRTKKVVAPLNKGSNVRMGTASINGGRTFVVSHTEYLDDITGLQDWDITSDAQVYILQPGLATEFPWLAPLAANFEQYRWKKLIFHYRTRSPSTTAGAVYMGTQYNVNDANFSSKAAMFNYVGTSINEVWTSYSHNCLLNRADYLKKYFVRVGDLDTGAGQDPQMYDAGKFTYVPVSNPTGIVGELMVEYVVEFFNPKSNPNAVTNYSMEYDGEFKTGSVLPSTILLGHQCPVIGQFAPWGAVGFCLHEWGAAESRIHFGSRLKFSTMLLVVPVYCHEPCHYSCHCL